MRKEEMILGECYVIQRGTNPYRWLTINMGGFNHEGNICFYPNESKKPYFEKEANFGKDYFNFRGELTATEATPLEREWLSLCIKSKEILPRPTVIRELSYEIY